MNRWRVALIVASVAALLAVMLPARAEDPPPGEYTYAELQAWGSYTGPTPAEVGLPVCNPDTTWNGFETAEAAEAAISDSEVNSCMADPAQVTYSVGRPVADAGYHHNGGRTYGLYQGGRITVEVGNPGVDHSCGVCQFVAARTLAQGAGGRWIEAGWAEVSWKDGARYVYTQATDDGNKWHFYNQYPLVQGRYYVFRARDCAAGCAEVWWSGAWHLLQKGPDFRCMYSDGSNNCYQEEYLEVWSTSAAADQHPSMSAAVDGVGVNFKNTKIRTAPSTYYLWSDGSYPSDERFRTPYVVCWTYMDWQFRAGKNLSC